MSGSYHHHCEQFWLSKFLWSGTFYIKPDFCILMTAFYGNMSEISLSKVLLTSHAQFFVKDSLGNQKWFFACIMLSFLASLFLSLIQLGSEAHVPKIRTDTRLKTSLSVLLKGPNLTFFFFLIFYFYPEVHSCLVLILRSTFLESSDSTDLFFHWSSFMLV